MTDPELLRELLALRAAVAREGVAILAGWRPWIERARFSESAANLAFIQRFQRQYGAYRTVGAAVEAAYSSVHLWAQAVTAAGVPEVERIRSALAGQSFEGPGGIIRVDPSTHHCFKSFHLARIEAPGVVNITYSSPELIRPEPFPATRTRAQWEALLEHLHKLWDGKWLNPKRPEPFK